MQKFAAGIGGDVDTIGAMAGAVWGAANGMASLPADRLAKLEQRARLEHVASTLYTRTNQNTSVIIAWAISRR